MNDSYDIVRQYIEHLSQQFRKKGMAVDLIVNQIEDAIREILSTMDNAIVLNLSDEDYMSLLEKITNARYAKDVSTESEYYLYLQMA
jgi:6-pyruvoyl-tetrahydropterin synthase